MSASPPLFDATQPAWTVSQLARVVRRMLEGRVGPVWVRGEICELRVYQSGHWYFTLRDPDSQIRCVMWRSNALKLGQTRPPEGAQIYAFGTPTMWEERGEFRLNITELLATDAIGLKQLALDRVKQGLENDGLFDQSRKRALPELATSLAVVTSIDGAALRDIITVTRKRWPCVRLHVVGAMVQGEGAEAELVRALTLVNRLDVELCIIGRGGGGREDLSVFNSEAVCRALARVRVPTISAVGHETDISLTDLVADARAPTPSAAAEMAVADYREVLSQLEGLAVRVAGGLARRSRLASERLARTGDRLHGLLEGRLERRRRRLELLGAQLDALSPLRCLDRGYAVARTLDGRLLRRTADFPSGLQFELRVSDGSVPARAEQTDGR